MTAAMTAARLRTILERYPAYLGNPRLGNPRPKLGQIAAANDDSIVAEIVTVEGSRVLKLACNRYPGLVRQVLD